MNGMSVTLIVIRSRVKTDLWKFKNLLTGLFRTTDKKMMANKSQFKKCLFTPYPPPGFLNNITYLSFCQ